MCKWNYSWLLGEQKLRREEYVADKSPGEEKGGWV